MLSFPIDAKKETPLYEQIYLNIQKYILDGTLPAKTKLPSTRSLSANLGVSRNTVDTAYYQLQAEGYIDSAPKSGFFVCEILPSPLMQLPKEATTAEEKSPVAIPGSSATATGTLPPVDYDFSPMTVDISRFPYSVWRKLSKDCLNDQQELFLSGNHYGDLPLRQAIAGYIRTSREVVCRPEQVIIGAGVDYLLQMLSLLFRHLQLTEIGMENPGYIQAAYIFQNNGLHSIPCSLDTKGLSLHSVPKDCQILYVTPSHQYPLGSVMPVGRRQELLNWANRQENRYIIEDDHDSEFRYKGKPIPSLQGLDRQHVIYIGTFSKAIAPAIRVGYMVLPPSLEQAYAAVCGHYSCTVSRLEQAILTHFLSDGYFEKHVNRMRKIYKAKHDTLLSQLQPLLKKHHLKIHGDNAGMHLVVELPKQISEEAFIANARRRGVQLYGLKEHYLDTSNALSAILLGYSNLSDTEITEGIHRLAQLLEETS